MVSLTARCDVERFGPQFDMIGRHSYPGVSPDGRTNMKSFMARAAGIACLACSTCLVCLTPACVKIAGGSVEISWVVIAPDGRAITDCGCAMPAIAKVRLSLVGVGGDIDGVDACAGQAQCDFPCQRQTGATPFDIKPTQNGESYSVSVVALGADGSLLSQVTTPAPILRQVVYGQPTEVEAFTLVAMCSYACNGSVCASP